MSFLMPLFIAAAIFGIGIIIIDLFGILGHFYSSHDLADNGHQFADDGRIDHDGHVDHDGYIDHDINHGLHDYNPVSEVLQDQKQKSNPVIAFLNILRNAVYFSAGFGPVGIFMQLMKKSAAESLLWSLVSGTVIMGMTMLIKRLIPRDTVDSQLTDDEIMLARGEVIVSIESGKMGKVRLHFEGFYTDRYAISKDKNMSLMTGEAVRVIEVREDVLVVDQEKNFEDNII